MDQVDEDDLRRSMSALRDDLERERVRLELQALRQRLERQQRRARNTTLCEYSRVYTQLLLGTMSAIRTEDSQSTTTGPQAERLPRRLSPWPDFPAERDDAVNVVQPLLSPDARLFKSLESIDTGRRDMPNTVVNEADVARLQHFTVEDPVSAITAELARLPFGLDIEAGIAFDHHANASGPPHVSLQSLPGPIRNQPNAEQLSCAYKDDEDKHLAFIVSYKSPSQFTPAHLRQGLRDMDVSEEAFLRETLGNTNEPGDDESTGIQREADRLSLAAVTDIFHHMIECGLEYSYVTTGEAFIFLKIDWEKDPGVLLFHLAEPRAEMEANDGNLAPWAAIYQVFSFALLALKSQQDGPEEYKAEEWYDSAGDED